MPGMAMAPETRLDREDPEAVLHDYADRIGRMLAMAGMPPMAGRIWGWLLVCDPPEQTAADLAHALGASRGSISGMVRLLESAGLVRRGARRGDRREYISVPPGSISAVLESRVPATVAWRRTAEEGLALLAEEPASRRSRLEELRAVYAFMERELPAMLDRFRVEWAGRIREGDDAPTGRKGRTT